MYIAIANSIYSSTLQGSGGGFPKASFALDFDTIADDFTFTRNSFATRVNEFGLIETVTDLGPDTIQNGNFEELGSELVTNGDFENGSTDWTENANWSIADGKATSNGSSGNLQQGNVLTANEINTYLVAFDIVEYNSGNVRPNIHGNVSGTPRSAVGTYSEYITGISSANTSLFMMSSSFNGSIDNVSVKQVDPNDDWDIEALWTIQDGVASGNGATGSSQELNQNISSSGISIGSTVRGSFEIKNYVSGSVQVIGISNTVSRSSNGIYEFQGDITSFNIRFRGAAFYGDITNVSVQEVLEDDVPRIDYSTGEAAFLLEPISTNFIDYSEDIEGSNWTTSGIATTTDVTTSPDGTQNADLIDSVSNGSCFISDSTLTFTIGNTYTFSVFAKKGNNDWIRTAHVSSATNASWFDLENGVVGTVNGVSGTIEDFGNGWYKCTNTFVATQATGGNQVFIGICDANGSTDAGASGQNDYVWGMQVEELSYATSYIPTSGTTVTRAQETCVNATPTINSEEGVLYWEASALSEDGINRYITLSNGTTLNRLITKYGTSNAIQLVSINPNGGANMIDLSGTDILTNHKIAFRYQTNNYAMFVDGVKVDEDLTSGTFDEGILTELNFANSTQTGQNFYGRTKDLRIYDKALTDDELINLTTI